MAQFETPEDQINSLFEKMRDCTPEESERAMLEIEAINRQVMNTQRIRFQIKTIEFYQPKH